MKNFILGCIKAALVIILVALIISVVLVLPVYLLWNWVGVVVLGLKEVTFLQAFGLVMLSTLLFKSSTSSK